MPSKGILYNNISVFDYFLNLFQGHLVSVLKIGRLLRLLRVGRRMSPYLEYTGTLLILMLFTFGLLAHWLACIWYVIGYEELRKGQTTGWLYKLGGKFCQIKVFLKALATTEPVVHR